MNKTCFNRQRASRHPVGLFFFLAALTLGANPQVFCHAADSAIKVEVR